MSRTASLWLLGITQVAVLSLWFAASAVAPVLRAEYALSGNQMALLSSAVQAGFVVGSLFSASLALADVFEPRRMYLFCALGGATANAAFLLVEPGTATSIGLRFVTGAVMAGVYPIGMKIAMSWADKDAGLLVGSLVGALTVGSAMPHLFAFAGGVDWRFAIAASSIAAALGAFAILFVGIGPKLGESGRINPRVMLNAWASKPVQLANFGYFGHMWELYAVWSWIGAFLLASFAAANVADPAGMSKLGAFATIAIGAVGCLFGGWIADRLGRTALTMAALGISGTCCLLAGLAFGAPPWIVMTLCLVWGITVVADSAQFSTSIAELAEPGTQGTLLTAQTAVGFALSMVTIQLMPHWVAFVGWRWAFAPLAIGPVFGIMAMAKLRGLPEAVKLANGRR